MSTIDARGLPCPEPVIMTKTALAKGANRATILVDNKVAVSNITRFAETKKLAVCVKEIGEDFEITIK